MAISRQPARATSPKVQKTTIDSCVSLAKNCNKIVPEVNSEDSATPESTTASVDSRLRLASDSTTAVAPIAPAKANAVTK